MERGFDIKALGEIAIRCGDVGRQVAFYRDVLGLEVLSGSSDDDGIVFFRIGPGYGGHTAVLALFARDAGRAEIHPHTSDAPRTGAGSSLHHLALTVDHEAQENAMRWFSHHGIDYRVEVFDWIGWRGVFCLDPEGNTVELVAFDPSLLAADGQEKEDSDGKGVSQP
ncbi:VOC family protein [Palleronia caenipelagi]|uniref:VOC family protein n=1 Tax=Palleronia caenipelagi TaxID=2489174 RepID=A0A547Q6U0_9RHOB|nr:VOC family protein [Palleronia caenipelagi]TRD22102.1 VOC family protein [Palleronia caenipelagi]